MPDVKEPQKFDLQRFVEAQDPVYTTVLAELRSGAKRSHWIWFIFPQLRDLGRSPTAKHFGLASLEEARAYWQHPVLGPRLLECTRLVLGVEGKSALEILGPPDDLKFRSCVTLFGRAAPDEPAFARAIDRYFAGGPDRLTLDLLSRAGPPYGVEG